MKKTLLALAIAGLSANAVAAIDVAEKDHTPMVVAKEITLSANNYHLTAGTVADLMFETPLDLATGDQILVTYQFSDNVKVTQAGLDLAGEALVLTAQEDNKLVYSKQLAANAGADSVMTLDVTKYEVTGTDAVTVQVTLEKVIGATNVVQLDKTQTLFTFGNAVAAVFDANDNAAKIDVATQSTLFTGNPGTTTVLGSAGYELVDYDGENAVDANFADITSVNAVVDSYTVAFKSTATLEGYKTITVDGTELVVNEDDVTLAESKTGDTEQGVVPFVLEVAADNEVAIPVSESNVTLTPKAATGYTLAATTDSGAIAPVEKNGSFDSVLFLNAPESTYPGFIRITNDSSLTGNVYLTVIRDNGETASFTLDTVAGQEAALAPQNSTALISSAALVEAAGWTDVTATEKLRVEVDAETTSISVESFSLSTDNNSFSKN